MLAYTLKILTGATKSVKLANIWVKSYRKVYLGTIHEAWRFKHSDVWENYQHNKTSLKKFNLESPNNRSAKQLLVANLLLTQNQYFLVFLYFFMCRKQTLSHFPKSSTDFVTGLKSPWCLLKIFKRALAILHFFAPCELMSPANGFTEFKREFWVLQVVAIGIYLRVCYWIFLAF